MLEWIGERNKVDCMSCVSPAILLIRGSPTNGKSKKPDHGDWHSYLLLEVYLRFQTLLLYPTLGLSHDSETQMLGPNYWVGGRDWPAFSFEQISYRTTDMMHAMRAQSENKAPPCRKGGGLCLLYIVGVFISYPYSVASILWNRATPYFDHRDNLRPVALLFC
jgi:hypothetical protein